MRANVASFVPVLVLFALTGPNPAARADDFFWNSPAGGVYGEGANWNDVADDVIPGPGDTAIFDLVGVYAVDFLEPRAAERVLLRAGIVTFDLAGGLDYTLESASVLAPGMSVGDASMTVATLEIRGGGVAATYVDLGAAPGSVGTVVLHESTTLDAAEQIHVGAQGAGTLDASGGATITSTLGKVAQALGSFGDASLEGAGTSWTIDGLLSIGDGGFGSLEIANGADVTSGQGIVAQGDGTQGVVVVTGPGSTWTVDGPIDVGMRGFGTMIVEDGADVVSNGFSTIGTFPGLPPKQGGTPGEGGVGEVVIDGAGSTWTVTGGLIGGDLWVGFFNIGVLELRGGGRVFVDGDLSALDNSLAGGMAPLVFVIESAGDYDAPAMVAGGDADVEAIRVEIDPSYAPAFGDVFRLVSASSGLDRAVSIELPDLPAPFIWGVTQTATSLEVIVGSDVCEPGDDPDCNGNGLVDTCDLIFGASADCNDNGVPDECDLADMTEDDCNGNGIPDSCDVTEGSSDDCDGDGVPDECTYATEPASLLDSRGEAGDGFGISVAVGGERLVVGGAPGRVLIFSQRGVRWVREADLSPSDRDEAEDFGFSVAIDGERVVVGSRSEDADVAGSAFVFGYDGDVWSEVQRLVPPEPDVSLFGQSVDIEDDWIVVGARREDRGIAYLYRDLGGTWTFDTAIEVEDIPVVTFGFGAGVDLDGDALAVGWRGVSVGLGAVQMARRVGGAWQLETLITPPPGRKFEIMVDVGLTGDVVGVPSQGQIFTYRYDGEAWREDATLRGADLGTQLDASDGRLIARAGDGAIVYRDDDGAWTVDAVLTSPGGAGEPALDGERALLGVPGDDTIAENAGAAYVYELAGPDCNGNDVADACDIADGTSDDLDGDGVPDECAETCPWDLTGSGSVGFTDLARLLGEWGFCPNCVSDVDGDDQVGFDELVQLLGSWGPCP